MTPRPNILEQTAPPEVRALMAAFREATGLPVTLTYERARVLGEIAARCEPPLGPEDVKAVVVAIRRDLAGARPRFNEASLQFGNLFGDPDVFEDRALACRAQAARKRARAAGDARDARAAQPIPHIRQMPDGSTVTVLAPAGETREVPVADAAEALRGIADSLKLKP